MKRVKLRGRLKTQIPLGNSRGQFVIEAILLAIITLSLFMVITEQLRKGRFIGKLVSEPWSYIAGMSESGVWEQPDQARRLHPNQIDRSLSLEPR